MAKAAKKYHPGLGVDYKIQADEIEAGVVIGAMAGFFTVAEVAADFDAASIGRSKSIIELAVPFSVPIAALRSDAGAALVAAETAGSFNVNVAANVIRAQAEITDNETEVSVGYFQFQLPESYAPGGAVTVRLPVKLVKTGAAVDNASFIDISVYKQAALAVGADLCSTAQQVFAAVDTQYNKDFVVTPTGLVPGDVLNVKVTSNIVDSEAGAGTLRLNLDCPIVFLDVQG